MDIDPLIILAGLAVGFVVGLTGMGGGALTTPLLVILFGIQPLAAVSSDLVAAFVMKPVGGAVHLRSGTVQKPIVGWLMLGSIPAAFCGVLLLRVIGEGADAQEAVKLSLGAALVFAAAAMLARQAMTQRRGQLSAPGNLENRPRARVIVTIAIGIFGGVVVGMTSVGSGSLMIVLLMLVYPRLTMPQLVGTDLVQAVPLVGAAAIGHLIFGDFDLGLTTSLLIGSLPGVFVGAQLSTRASFPLLRPALITVLVLSGAKLLHADNVMLAALFVILVSGFTGAWLLARVRASARAAAEVHTAPDVASTTP